MMALSDSERISMIRSAVVTQSTRVTDRRTDGIGVAYTPYSMLSRVKKTPTPRARCTTWHVQHIKNTSNFNLHYYLMTKLNFQ